IQVDGRRERWRRLLLFVFGVVFRRILVSHLIVAIRIAVVSIIVRLVVFGIVVLALVFFGFRLLAVLLGRLLVIGLVTLGDERGDVGVQGVVSGRCRLDGDRGGCG